MEMEEAPKKRLRGKQKYDAPADLQMDTLAASKPSPKKRLRGKQAVDAPEAPKPKQKAPKKGGPRAQQFTEKMQAHLKGPRTLKFSKAPRLSSVFATPI